MKRPYLLGSKVPGIADRLVSADSRAAALAFVAKATWDATPVDQTTVKAFGNVGIVLEGSDVDQAELELDGAEGGE